MADVSLSLELSAAAMPGQPELYAPDVGRRRKALLANWNRLHEIRAVRPGRAPSPRALRLEVETDALAALAMALTEAGGQKDPGPAGEAAPPGRAAVPAAGASAPPGETPAPLPAAGKRVFGAELRTALRSRGASLNDAAQALSLTPEKIAHWEGARTSPPTSRPGRSTTT